MSIKPSAVWRLLGFARHRSDHIAKVTDAFVCQDWLVPPENTHSVERHSLHR